MLLDIKNLLKKKDDTIQKSFTVIVFIKVILALVIKIDDSMTVFMVVIIHLIYLFRGEFRGYKA